MANPNLIRILSLSDKAARRLAWEVRSPRIVSRAARILGTKKPDRLSVEQFCIKERYRARSRPRYFADSVDDGVTWQPEVYPFVAEFAEREERTAIIDLGCGRAEKLSRLHEIEPEWDYIGVDYGPNIDWCRAHYCFGAWLDADFEAIHAESLAIEKEVINRSVIVCSDVIEHLRDPRPTLGVIRCLLEQGAAGAVISTPERDLHRGLDDYGPPLNPCHTREWNSRELRAFLELSGFQVAHLGLTASNDAGLGDKTILAVCKWA